MGTEIKINGVNRVIGTEKLGYGKTVSFRSGEKSYDRKVLDFFRYAEYSDFVCQELGVAAGDTLQIQNPSRRGEAVVYCGICPKDKKPFYLDDVLIVAGDGKGCYNYVASLDQSKNSGQYQSKARRVHESSTYLVRKTSSVYRLELLLDNLEWLDAEKSEEALMKLAKVQMCKSTSPTEIRSCKVRTDKFSLDLKIARVKKVKSFKGEEMIIVLSLNSGKIWYLPAEQVELGDDVSKKSCIMTQFVWLKQVGASGNFYISE